MSAVDAIALALGLGLAAYVTVALLRPEWFE
jgi:K+-transporting ATPase KdpF subunit